VSTFQKRLGNYGEKIAQEYLLQKGYTLLATNWHCRYGELDIIAERDNVLVFVEVKTRRSKDIQEAIEMVTPAKTKKLIQTIHIYLSSVEREEDDWRFDILAIAVRDNHPIIEHVENALDW
jgi:putative endonuclease